MVIVVCRAVDAREPAVRWMFPRTHDACGGPS